MKTLKTITSLLAGCAITLGSLGSDLAIAEIMRISGKTYQGDYLFLDTDTIFDARNGEISFTYTVVDGDTGKRSEVFAVTPYCYEGAIDSDVSYKTLPSPGWFLGGDRRKPIILTSTPYIRLLETVCNRGYGKIYGE